MQSKKTSLMTTPKHLGTQIFRWTLRYTRHKKLPVPGGEFFADLCCQWEPIWNSQVFRWSAQIYPPTICQMKWQRLDVRWCTQIGCQIYPLHNLSDEVTKIRCEMTCPDRLPDIPPTQLARWSDQDLMWDDVPRKAARYTPYTTCQMKWPRSDVRWHAQIGCQIYPPHNLSDEVTKISCEMTYPDRLPDISPGGNIEFSGLAIWYCYWHLVVKNGNFTFLLTSSGQEWQFHIPTDILWSSMATR